MTSSRTAEFVARLASPTPETLAQLHNPDDVTARILRATLEQAELVGIRRITMPDVAKRSGVGRATLYRRFPSKGALIEAMVLTVARGYLDGNRQARAQGETLEDRILFGTVFAIQFLRNNPLLRKLLRTEPETLLPSLTIDAGAIIDFATEHSAGLLRADLYGDRPTTPGQERHLRTVAELQTRLTLSFVVTPHTGIKLENLDQAREYVRAYLMPMITGPGSTAR
jgi:AcrR family transcriptional regulator